MTDEPEAKAKPYAQKNRMEYLVAYGGGANGYVTRGIPNAWLVDPNGKIVYAGHPSRITADLIEEHIKGVRLTPSFELGEGLEKASRHLAGAKYGKGVGELQKVIDKNEDSDLVARARAAIAEVESYGEKELAAVDGYAEAGYYTEGYAKLQRLASAFKRTSLEERIDAKLDAWKDDDRIQAEIAGEQFIAKAKEQVGNRKYKDAARTLVAVTRGKKFEGTKAQARAQALLDDVMNKL